ncbi:uncharacterized protein LOC131004757 [Salvia miltiorrhiza]|uniref:uncharacterized protein LOC131004757 n=1 Tax=Salvia miltiorrhiza TaxID=226208 RepID=UPI0025AD124F|nr:uncharacterized protein LOC131004757 [Salvia miltiorrhiza]
MSSATQGSNGFVRGGRLNKTDKTRRSWSAREEEVLLAALKELVAQGWKSDNGFRAGYLNKLEEAMKKEYPTTDLKGMPHINSKITIWKKNYSSLSYMLGKSGIGFNLKGTHTIDCDDEQWQAILNRDSNARLMRYKSWPHLDDWRVIFGKDRATGEGAEDIMEAAHEMYRNIDLTEPHVDGDYHVTLDDMYEPADADDSVSQSVKASPEVRSSTRKRKRDDGIDRMFAALSEITTTTGDRLETLASRMGYDFDISKARKEVFAQLGSISGLTLKDKFEITDLLAKEVERLDVFTSLPDEAKSEYVHYLLDMKLK